MRNLMFLILLLTARLLTGTIINVPADQPTIQSGIDAASFGDTVLVAEGTYYENINYNGKQITVASYYILDQETSHINNTIIDGSQYTDIDFASCVIMLSNEGPNTVLDGFTLRGGKGSKVDLSVLNPAWQAYTQEGGGVIMFNSTATIRNNLIIDNDVPFLPDCDYSGGGGVCSFVGNPTIINNVIAKNSSGYACGIVLNWSGGTIKNNIVYANSGGSQEGAGGIMVWDNSQFPQIVENNSILANFSSMNAGGILIYNTAAEVRNNIIWGNKQVSGMQAEVDQSSIFEYCCLEEIIFGTGHIYDYPWFEALNFIQTLGSPTIDAGNPDVLYNDIESPNYPGFAAFPSRGELINDIGAYGGPGAKMLVDFSNELLQFDEYIQFDSFVFLGNSVTKSWNLDNLSTMTFHIDSLVVDNPEIQISAQYLENPLEPLFPTFIDLIWTPTTAGQMSSSLHVYHNFQTIDNPIDIDLTGNAIEPISNDENTIQLKTELAQNFPNPFNPETTISFSLAKSVQKAEITIYNLKGQKVKQLFRDQLPAGQHSLVWNGTDDDNKSVTSGVYLYSLTVDKKMTETKKCILMK